MKIFLAVILSFLTIRANAQTIMPLYPTGQVPNFRTSGEKEKRDSSDVRRISLVQQPTIAVYLPPKRNASGHAVVICPGGGYGLLSYEWEGVEIAKWLNSKGIAAIVLKYRLPNSKSNITPHLSPLMDAQRAIRIVRANAAKWNISANKIGIMGFSAGGHLASTALTKFDNGNPSSSDSVERQGSRPDFGVLVYPVITMTKPVMHAGSRNNLIGQNADSSLAKRYSSEWQVTKETPPTFLVHALDDKSVPMENSLMFFQAMKENGVSGELHVYPKGGHGFGLAVGKGNLEKWTELCVEWMRSIGNGQ